MTAAPDQYFSPEQEIDHSALARPSRQLTRQVTTRSEVGLRRACRPS